MLLEIYIQNVNYFRHYYFIEDQRDKEDRKGYLAESFMLSDEVRI